MIESPCVKICRVDEAGVCVACGRSIAEIAAWITLDDPEREQVCRRAAARLQEIAQSPAQ